MTAVDSTALALDAVTAAATGDLDAAVAHLEGARSCARAQARRDRQVVEVAGAIVAGDQARASGLAAEHRREFPGDEELLAALLAAGSPSVGRW